MLEDIERQQLLEKRAETMNLGFVPIQCRGRIRPTVPTKVIKRPRCRKEAVARSKKDR
jgi:hypothetical protein